MRDFPPPPLTADETLIPYKNNTLPVLANYAALSSTAPAPGFGVLKTLKSDGTPYDVQVPLSNDPYWRMAMALTNTTTIFGDYPVALTPDQTSVWDTATAQDYAYLYPLAERAESVSPGTYIAPPLAAGSPSYSFSGTPSGPFTALPSGYTADPCATQPVNLYAAHGNGLHVHVPQDGPEGPTPTKQPFLWQLPGTRCR
jgi:hypothetical protein